MRVEMLYMCCCMLSRSQSILRGHARASVDADTAIMRQQTSKAFYRHYNAPNHPAKRY